MFIVPIDCVRLGSQSMMWLLETDMHLWKDHFEKANKIIHEFFLLIYILLNLYFIHKSIHEMKTQNQKK